MNERPLFTDLESHLRKLPKRRYYVNGVELPDGLPEPNTRLAASHETTKRGQWRQLLQNFISIAVPVAILVGKSTGTAIKASLNKDLAAARRFVKWQANKPLPIRLALLSGSAMFMAHGDGATALQSQASSDFEFADASGAVMTLRLPYSEAQMNKRLASINDFQYAPGQQKQINALIAVQYEIGQIDKLAKTTPSAALAARRTLLERQVAQQKAQLKPNDKLAALIATRAAILMTDARSFHGALAGMSAEQRFVSFASFQRIESLWTVDTEAMLDGGKSHAVSDHARGIVQIRVPEFLTTLARHYDKLKLPANEAHAYDGLGRALNTIMDDYAAKHYPGLKKYAARKLMTADQHKMMAALNDASADNQAVIRTALVDKTPIRLYGDQTTRGAYLSAVMGQYFFDDNCPKLPQDLVGRYSLETLQYNFWQLGGPKFKQLIGHIYALSNWDKGDSKLSSARNPLEPLLAALTMDDAKLTQLSAKIKEAKPKLKAKPAKSGKSVKAPEPPLKLKQLLAEQKAVQDHRAAMKKQANALQKTYDTAHAPWDSYVRDMASQAKYNPLWKDKNGMMRMPDDALRFIRKDLFSGVPATMKALYANWVKPLKEHGTQPAMLAAMPRLIERDHRLVYVAKPGLVPVMASRPAWVQVAYNMPTLGR